MFIEIKTIHYLFCYFVFFFLFTMYSFWFTQQNLKKIPKSRNADESAAWYLVVFGINKAVVQSMQISRFLHMHFSPHLLLHAISNISTFGMECKSIFVRLAYLQYLVIYFVICVILVNESLDVETLPLKMYVHYFCPEWVKHFML